MLYRQEMLLTFARCRQCPNFSSARRIVLYVLWTAYSYLWTSSFKITRQRISSILFRKLLCFSIIYCSNWRVVVVRDCVYGHIYRARGGILQFAIIEYQDGMHSMHSTKLVLNRCFAFHSVGFILPLCDWFYVWPQRGLYVPCSKLLREI